MSQVIPSKNKRVKKEATPPFPPTEGACHFYIPKKNRYCKMVPGKNQTFCGEHIMSDSKQDVPSKKVRIPCPIDPSHTCFQNQLKKHLKICNARQEEQPPGFVRNINAGPEDIKIPDKITINDLSPEGLKTFIDKVVKASSEDDIIANIDDRPIECKEHSALKDELTRSDVSEDGLLKHARQQASILGHMEEAGLLSDGNCFVEMGAGRGHVNHWIQRALGDETDAQFILVDKQGVRYKMDSQHREDSDGPKFHRLRMDIQHLRLREVPEINSRSSPIVVVSKHLCGAATDLTLRCCIPDEHGAKKCDVDDGNLELIVDSFRDEKVESTPPSKENTSKQGPRVIGIVIALCCHHRVDYRSYVGHSYLASRGFVSREFWLLRSLSSWATCGFTYRKKKEGEDEDEDEEDVEAIEGVEEKVKEIESRKTNSGSNGITSDESPTDVSLSSSKDETDFKKLWEWYYKMTVEEKSAIGRRCKRLLDNGRIDFIKNSRPSDNVRLVKYVDSSTSLENVLLLVHS